MEPSTPDTLEKALANPDTHKALEAVAFLELKRGKDITVGLTDKTNYRGELKEVLDIGLVVNVVDRDVLICWTSIKEVF